MTAPLHAPAHPSVRTDGRTLGLIVSSALLVVFAAIVAAWALYAQDRNAPQLSTVFATLVIAGSVAVVVVEHAVLKLLDWVIALVAGVFLGWLVPATGFYPLLAELFPPGRLAPWAIAVFHGAGLTVAFLAGLAIMRLGGPVQVRLANGDWKKALIGLGFGALVGLPLAVLNAFANTFTQNRPFVFQASPFPLVEALQPAVVEEVVYRLALLGMAWMLFRKVWPAHAVLAAAIASLVVHTYGHYGNLLLEQPVMWFVICTVMGLIWGVPLTYLALKRDLESAVGFHWVQDAARFLGGL